LSAVFPTVLGALIAGYGAGSTSRNRESFEIELAMRECDGRREVRTTADIPALYRMKTNVGFGAILLREHSARYCAILG
jgi:hypothetical protein